MASSVALAIRVLTLDGAAPPQLARALGVILTSGGHSSCAPHAPRVTSILRLVQSTSTGGKESGPAPAEKLARNTTRNKKHEIVGDLPRQAALGARAVEAIPGPQRWLSSGP
jgi:hypothetical protein